MWENVHIFFYSNEIFWIPIYTCLLSESAARSWQWSLPLCFLVVVFYLILIICFSFLLCVISCNAGYSHQYLYMCLHAGTLIISLFFWSSIFFILRPSGTLMNSSFQYTPLCQIVNYQNVWPSVLIKSPEESCLYTCERACSV